MCVVIMHKKFPFWCRDCVADKHAKIFSSRVQLFRVFLASEMLGDMAGHIKSVVPHFKKGILPLLAEPSSPLLKTPGKRGT